ncbi:MAG TPA: hypothetical protein VJN65_02680 [Bacteroidota bacterium]|nr:hypothetical protein [Bacteroidota bacterium]
MRRYQVLFLTVLLGCATAWAQDFRQEWPRIMVIFDEKVDGEPVDARIVATRLEEIFLEKGFRLVDKAQFEAVTARDITLAESNPMRAKEIGLRYGAEWIVVGKVEATFDAEKEFYGIKNYEYASKGSGKIIITDTGEMIAVTTKNTKKSATGKSSASTGCLTALSELIANDLYVKSRVRIKQEESGPRFIQIAMVGLDDKMIAQLEKSLPQDLPLINYLKLRYFEKDGAVFDANVNGTVDDLRRELGKRPDLAIIGFTGSRVDISTKENAEKAKGSVAVTSPLEITQFSVENIFPSQVNYYAYNSLAMIEVENSSKSEIRNVKVSVFVPGYMNLPSEQIVAKVDPGSKQTFKLAATFDSKQLYTLSANATAQAKVELSYIYNNTPQTRSLVRPVTLYNRNTISWRRGESIGAFITDTDDAVVAFSRYVIGSVGGSDVLKTSKLPRQVVNALAVWNGVRAFGINYVSDPWKTSEGEILDQIQYPRETLASKTGDCDDSSVLLASCLENVGIRTKLIGTSDHIFIMFDTELSPKNAYVLSLDEKEVIAHEGTVWVPLETTMINEPFTKAWRMGAQEYYKNVESGGKLEIIDTRKAKEAFPPANLPSTVRPATPSAERIIQLASADLTDYEYHQSQLLGSADKMKTSENPADKNKAAVMYAKAGDYESAAGALFGVNTPEAYNTLGNVYLMKNELPTAQEYYQKALAMTTDDGGIYMNFGLARYLSGSEEDAMEAFQAAISKYESREKALEVLGLERINEVLGTRAAGKSEVQVSKADIFALIGRSLQNVPEKGKSLAQASRVREKYKDQQNKYVFGGRRGADPTQIASIKEFLYWKE